MINFNAFNRIDPPGKFWYSYSPGGVCMPMLKRGFDSVEIIRNFDLWVITSDRTRLFRIKRK